MDSTLFACIYTGALMAPAPLPLPICRREWEEDRDEMR